MGISGLQVKSEEFQLIHGSAFRRSFGRVRGGIFTHPSLGTVLESLPSHGSSHLLFVNFIIITKVASFIVSSSICRVGL